MRTPLETITKEVPNKHEKRDAVSSTADVPPQLMAGRERTPSGWEKGALHQNARSAHPAYPERMKVPDEHVMWDVPWSSYSPPAFTHTAVVDNDCSVKKGGWADPMSVSALTKEEWSQRVSHEGPVMFDAQGRPVNPRGRTGLADRGLLGKWGPNHAG